MFGRARKVSGCHAVFATVSVTPKSVKTKVIAEQIKITSANKLDYALTYIAIIITKEGIIILIVIDVSLQYFTGNRDRNSIVTHAINPPLLARFVRIHPKSWSSHICMRVELYGCRAGKGRFSLAKFVVLFLEVVL